MVIPLIVFVADAAGYPVLRIERSRRALQVKAAAE